MGFFLIFLGISLLGLSLLAVRNTIKRSGPQPKVSSLHTARLTVALPTFCVLLGCGVFLMTANTIWPYYNDAPVTITIRPTGEVNEQALGHGIL
jgi:hypothetical protein